MQFSMFLLPQANFRFKIFMQSTHILPIMTEIRSDYTHINCDEKRRKKQNYKRISEESTENG